MLVIIMYNLQMVLVILSLRPQTVIVCVSYPYNKAGRTIIL
jgi:hypothetical protein